MTKKGRNGDSEGDRQREGDEDRDYQIGGGGQAVQGVDRVQGG